MESSRIGTEKRVVSPGQKRRSATEIVKSLRSRGYQAYWAGGCVRDMIMGKIPKDYDIATDARPDDVRAIFRKTIPVGEKFGVVLVLKRGVPFEIATFRGERAYRDGRHPEEVYFTDSVEDVKRRDFTINGLLYDPLEDTIIDHVDGRSDIEAGLIRTIGNPRERFDEDHLRLLRAVRFAAGLNFDLEEETREAIKVRSADIGKISMERIRDELIKILTGPGPRRGFELMDEVGILVHVIPEIVNMHGVEQPPEFHPEGDVFVHTMMMLELMDEPSEELALGVLLHDVGKPDTYEMKDRIRFNNHCAVGADMAEEILERLRFPKKTVKKVVALVRKHLHFMNIRNMRENKLKRFIKDPDFDDHLELHRLDCLASHGDLSIWEFCVEKRDEYKDEVIPPPALVTGKDLIDLGFCPGPVFSEILSFVQDLQIDGRIGTYDEAVDVIESTFGHRRGGDTG